MSVRVYVHVCMYVWIVLLTVIGTPNQNIFSSEFVFDMKEQMINNNLYYIASVRACMHAWVRSADQLNLHCWIQSTMLAYTGSLKLFCTEN